jgi:hypothetical protein
VHVRFGEEKRIRASYPAFPRCVQNAVT